MNSLRSRLTQLLCQRPSLQAPQARSPGELCAFRWSPVRFAGGPAPYPPKTRFRKMFKGRCEGIYGDGSELKFGTYGIKVLYPGKITYQTIEAARRVLARTVKGKGQMWVRVQAEYPITKKPLEVRMGKGKGSVAGYVARCKAGKILFEVDGLHPVAAKEVLTQVGHKIGLRTKIISYS